MKGNNMKMIAKIAACGLLSLTLQTAFAQSAAVSSRAAEAIKSSQTAKRFAEQRLGLKTGASSADLTAAISKLGTAEQAAVISAINAYSSKAIQGNSAAAVMSNEALAKSIFAAKDGQILELAALTSKSGTRAGTAKAGECSTLLDATKMSADTKVSYADVQAAIAAGTIKRGKCDEDPQVMGVGARENLNQAGVCALNKGAASLKGAARDQVVAGCLTDALNDDGGVQITAAQGMERLQNLNKCGYLGQTAN